MIIVCSILVLIVLLAIWSIIRDKRKGRTSCGCKCSSCALSGTCHQKSS